MTITGFYVGVPQRVAGRAPARSSNPHSRAIRRAKKIIHVCLGMLIVLMTAHGLPAMANPIGAVAGATFGPGGPGSIIAQLMLIAVVGWLCGYIAQAAGKGQIAGMIHVATVFSCIAIVADVAYRAIDKIGHFLG